MLSSEFSDGPSTIGGLGVYLRRQVGRLFKSLTCRYIEGARGPYPSRAGFADGVLTTFNESPAATIMLTELPEQRPDCRGEKLPVFNKDAESSRRYTAIEMFNYL